MNWGDIPATTEAEIQEKARRLETRNNVEYVKANRPIPDTGPLDMTQYLASNIKMERVEWLWEGRIPTGEITLVSGEGGTRKSWAMCDLAARISQGSTWPCSNMPVERGMVLLISGEDGGSKTVVPRLEAQGADMNMVHVVDASNATQFFSFDRLDNLHRGLTTKHKMLIIDPDSCFFGSSTPGRRTDTNNSVDVRTALNELVATATRLNMAIMINHHFKKGDGKGSERISGSHAFRDLPRSGFVVYTDRERDTVSLLVHDKHNLAAKQAPLEFEVIPAPGTFLGLKLEWRLATAESVLAAEDTKSKRDHPVDAWIMRTLSRGRILSDELMRLGAAEGYSERTMERAKHRLSDSLAPQKEQGPKGRWTIGLKSQTSEQLNLLQKEKSGGLTP